MKRFVMAAFALLAGCATPDKLIATGERSEHMLIRPPALATACMSRILDADRGSRFGHTTIPATIRPMDDGGSEMIVGTTLVARAKPEGTGSRVTIWLRPERFVGRSTLVATMTKGC